MQIQQMSGQSFTEIQKNSGSRSHYFAEFQQMSGHSIAEFALHYFVVRHLLLLWEQQNCKTKNIN